MTKSWKHGTMAGVLLVFALLAFDCAGAPERPPVARPVEKQEKRDISLVDGVPLEEQCQIRIGFSYSQGAALTMIDGKKVNLKGLVMIPPGEHTLVYDGYSVWGSVVRSLILKYNFLPGTYYDLMTDVDNKSPLIQNRGVTEWAVPGPDESLVVVQNVWNGTVQVYMDGNNMIFHLIRGDIDFDDIGRIIVPNGVHKLKVRRSGEEPKEIEINAASNFLKYVVDGSSNIVSQSEEKALDKVAAKNYGSWQGR